MEVYSILLYEYVSPALCLSFLFIQFFFFLFWIRVDSDCVVRRVLWSVHSLISDALPRIRVCIDHAPIDRRVLVVALFFISYYQLYHYLSMYLSSIVATSLQTHTHWPRPYWCRDREAYENFRGVSVCVRARAHTCDAGTLDWSHVLVLVANWQNAFVRWLISFEPIPCH